AWSADLTQVLFDARYEMTSVIVQVDMRTGERERLGFGGERPRWLPDGRIGYVSGGRIHVYDPTTGQTQILTPEGDYHDQPIWSPDGSQIALRIWVGGEDYALALMDADGSNGRVLMTGIT